MVHDDRREVRQLLGIGRINPGDGLVAGGEDPDCLLRLALTNGVGEFQDLRRLGPMKRREGVDLAMQGHARMLRTAEQGDVTQGRAGVHARQLIGVAHEHDRGVGGHRRQQVMQEAAREHRGLVHDHQLERKAFSSVVRVVFAAAGVGAE